MIYGIPDMEHASTPTPKFENSPDINYAMTATWPLVGLYALKLPTVL